MFIPAAINVVSDSMPALVSSVLFAMMHYNGSVNVTYNIITVIGAYIMGRYLYDIATASGIIAAILCHGWFNLLTTVISRIIVYYYYNRNVDDVTTTPTDPTDQVCKLTRTHPAHVLYTQRIRDTFNKMFPNPSSFSEQQQELSILLPNEQHTISHPDDTADQVISH